MTRTRTVETVDDVKVLREVETEDQGREEVEKRIQWLAGRIDKYTPIITEWEAEKADLEAKVQLLPR